MKIKFLPVDTQVLPCLTEVQLIFLSLFGRNQFCLLCTLIPLFLIYDESIFRFSSEPVVTFA